MGHKLEGKWHSHVVFKLPGGTTTEMAEDDIIEIVKVNETTGKIEDGSHIGKAISGSIIPAGTSFAVSMEHERSPGVKSRYEGAFVSEDPVNKILVIVGTKRRIPPLVKPASDGEVDVESGQVDGTWVATQP